MVKKTIEKNEIMSLYRNTKNERTLRFGQVENTFDVYLTNTFILPRIKNNSSRVLDLGCGAGRNAVSLAGQGNKVTAIDLYKTPLQIARKYAKERKVKKNVDFIQKDIFKIKKGEFKNFDYCLLQEVVEHVHDYQTVIDVAFRALKKGGVLLLTTPCDPKQWDLLDNSASHVRRFTKKEILNGLRNFSSVDLKITGFPFYRSARYVYNKFLLYKKRTHYTEEFMGNPFLYYVYTSIFPFLLMVDHIMDFTGLGNTFVIKAIK